MNISLSQRPRIRAAIAAASFAVLATSLTACGGNDGENTTCGDVKGMSDDELTSLVKDIADDEATDEEKAQLTDEDYSFLGQSLKLACNGQDDGTKLKDIEQGDIDIQPSDIPTDLLSDLPTDLPS